MNVSEQDYYEIIDKVVHEGEPELILGPIQAIPPDVPVAWSDLLMARDPGPAAFNLWQPMSKHLPRVCRSLAHRLQRVALLRTEEVPVSLLYFFKDGDNLYLYRGRPPLSDEDVVASGLPQQFASFYRIHDGWVSHYTLDDGPAPHAEWVTPAEAWPEVRWNLPPGTPSLDAMKTVFRDDGAFLLAYDTSVAPSRPLICGADGRVEHALDIWWTIDRAIGEFLEELEVAEPALPRTFVVPQDLPGAQREFLKTHPLSGDTNKACLPDGAAQHQTSELWLESALAERGGVGSDDRVRECYRKALREWCGSLTAGRPASPGELLDHFAIAHFLQDSPAAYFLATIPQSAWYDSTLGAAQVLVLLKLFLQERELAEAGLEMVLGLTFDGTPEVDAADEIIARLLESVAQKNRDRFAEWRRNAVTKLSGTTLRIPWGVRLSAFDAIAARASLL